jgi:hypothetical protein
LDFVLNTGNIPKSGLAQIFAVLFIILVQDDGLLQILRSVVFDMFKPTVPIEERRKVGTILGNRDWDLGIVSCRSDALTEPARVIKDECHLSSSKYQF